MSEGRRSTLFVPAQATGPGGRYVHIVDTISKGGFWCLCGEFIPNKRIEITNRDFEEGKIKYHVLKRLTESRPLHEVTCRSCLETELRQRQALKPGWWRNQYADSP